MDWNGQIFLCVKVISSRQSSQDKEKISCQFQSTENFPEWKLVLIDLSDYFLLPNGLVFMSNTYSCFVLSIGSKITLLLSLRTSRNKFVQENMGI